MIARSQLTVLDFNDGINNDQAKTKSSDLRYKQSFSKVANSWCIKPMKEDKKNISKSRSMKQSNQTYWE